MCRILALGTTARGFTLRGAPDQNLAHADGAHGRFWEMYDAVFENQAAWFAPTLHVCQHTRFVGGESPRSPRWRSCQDNMKRDFLGEVRSWVNGVRLFFINGGMTAPLMIEAILLQPWKPTFTSRCGIERDNPLAPNPRGQ